MKPKALDSVKQETPLLNHRSKSPSYCISVVNITTFSVLLSRPDTVRFIGIMQHTFPNPTLFPSPPPRFGSLEGGAGSRGARDRRRRQREVPFLREKAGGDAEAAF